MSNLAVILQKMGKKVTGSDTDEEQITDETLNKNKIPLIIGFEADRLPKDTQLVVYSAAHGGLDNPQVQEAKRRNIPIVHQAEFQGMLMDSFKTKIAVTGSHGKTTTTAMLSYCLLKLEAKLGYMVGTSTFNEYSGGDYLGNDFFVIEADEYGVNPPKDKTPKFHYLNPDITLTTNIDFDHPDVYSTPQESTSAYIKFINKGKQNYFCLDDPEVASALEKGLIKGKTYGTNSKADLIVSKILVNEQGSSFNVKYQDQDLGEIKLSVYGEKNVLNAAGVVMVLLTLGFDIEDIREVIIGFKGSKRRFELLFEKNGTYLFDDYAHHPAEIEATLAAARSRFKDKRLILIFQSHTFSRTLTLLQEFAQSLSKADLSYVYPIFPSARENKDDFKVSQQDVEKKAIELGKNNVKAVNSKEEVLTELQKNLKKNDIVFTMGAGDVYKLKSDIIEVIKGLN